MGLFDKANSLVSVPLLLPHGRQQGNEWVATNPKRVDKKAGSFRINLKTGRWADFALPDVRGGDFVSLWAYLFDLSQGAAAKDILRKHGR